MSATLQDNTILAVISQHDGDGSGALEYPEATVIIRFTESDPDNPFEWCPTKKWVTILTAEFYSMTTGIAATAYGEGTGSMQRDLHCSDLAVMGGITSYLIVCALAPLITAPISEQFGRRKMLLASSVVFTLCFLPQALAPNIALVILFRGVQGGAASAANSLVGGVVADVFQADTRGVPMSVFSFLILAGQGLGALAFGWVEMSLGFRWIAWIIMALSGAVNIALWFLLVETRGCKILEDRARRLTLQTGILHITDIDGSNAPRTSLLQLVKATASRPIVFLVTEPVVAAISIWAALLWGVVFLLYSSIPLVYAQYNFSVGEKGSVLVTVIIGALLGIFAARWQDYLYHQDGRRTPHGRAPPESRLYGACAGGLIVPISLFWFAWSGRPEVHWMVPSVALVLFNGGIFTIYLATFSYLADSYEQYGSSAIAAQSFLRNIFGGVFPLFTRAMYTNLGYPQASSLLGALASAFSILPFLLMAYGPLIRKKSRVAKQIAWQQEKRALEAERSATEQERDTKHEYA